MNVLHLISSGGMYGAEAVILGLSQQLRREGDRSSIAVFANASLELYERARSEGIPAYQIVCANQLDRATPQSVRDVVQQSGADVVHAHGYKADLYALAALKRAGVPLVSTCHTWYDNDAAVRVYGMLDRWALRWFHGVVAVSEDVERRLLASGVRPDRVRRIRNGVPLPERMQRKANNSALHVGLVGRLSPEKGVDIFIRAAAQAMKQLPHTRFTVFGEGPERPKLEALIASLGLGESLHLAGRTEAMEAVYAGLDLLVSASRHEGLPVALLEGMATGLPMVGTTVGEVPTLVHDRDTGVLVAPENPDALAEAMLLLLRDDALRFRCGERARLRIEQDFSVAGMTQEYRAVYREAIAEVQG